mmetsp:Transcript_64181/g.129019  ORF Transcript_64181/g.129019 Transcript_64181/m.129019 type:complete len:361 (+) Transcript_64181:577-1659(+)
MGPKLKCFELRDKEAKMNKDGDGGDEIVCTLQAVTPQAALNWISALQALQTTSGGGSSDDGEGGKVENEPEEVPFKRSQGDSSADGQNQKSFVSGDLVVWRRADADIPRGALGTVLQVIGKPTAAVPTRASPSTPQTDDEVRVLVRFPPAAEVLAASGAVAEQDSSSSSNDSSSSIAPNANDSGSVTATLAGGGVPLPATERMSLLDRGATFDLAAHELLCVGSTLKGLSPGFTQQAKRGAPGGTGNSPSNLAAPVVRVLRSRGSTGVVGGKGPGSFWFSAKGALFAGSHLAFCLCSTFSGLYAVSGSAQWTGFWLGATFAIAATPLFQSGSSSSTGFVGTVFIVVMCAVLTCWLHQLEK